MWPKGCQGDFECAKTAHKFLKNVKFFNFEYTLLDDEAEQDIFTCIHKSYKSPDENNDKPDKTDKFGNLFKLF